MSKILFDVNVPRAAARLLGQHRVEFSDQRGWRELSNGALLRAAEDAGFDVLLTADTNLRYQQNLAGRKIALVVLSTNAWPVIRESGTAILAAVERVVPGGYEGISLARPLLRRRAWPPSSEP